MKILLYVNSKDFTYKDKPTVVTIGNFDGFHRGHRVLIEKVNNIKLGRGLKSVAFSFNPRPGDVFRGIPSKSILSFDERVEAAKSLGIDILVEYPFSLEFSQMSGDDFIKDVLIGQYNCNELVIGSGFAFGKDRAWNATEIQEISSDLRVGVTVLSHEMSDNEKISSTNIREHLKNGEIMKANELLGYEYFLKGAAEKATGKNLVILPGEWKILPKSGEYITETRLQNGKAYQSITNIDSNGCIQNQIIGLNGFLCGEIVTIVFKACD